MFNKKIILNIFSSKTPYKLKILSERGKLIKESEIHSSCFNLMFCCKDSCITLLFSHKNQTIYQTILLSDCLCQNIFIGLDFKKILPPMILNSITLTDANYQGLPISTAILKFEQKQP